VEITVYLPQLSSRSVILRLIPRILRLRFTPTVHSNKYASIDSRAASMKKSVVSDPITVFREIEFPTVCGFRLSRWN
jgi:hypothetical protein